MAMKIKFNWGTGVVLAMVVMISAMSFLVYIAVRQDFDLVDNDYYEKSLAYQQHIDKVGNTASLEKKIVFQLRADSLKLIFPELASREDYAGKIHFYSPVEATRDFNLEVKLDASFSQKIALTELQKGRYQVKIDWSVNKNAYYQEEEIAVE
jgi:hypothetical protein